VSADAGQNAETGAGSTPGDAAERTPEEIKADIQETREDLADTVAALAEKADVKAQARKKVDETKANAKERISGVAGSAKAKAQDATPGGAQDAARQGAEAAQQTVRENPVPAAAVGSLLLGFVLGWLIARRS
jgi:ElaB/YqjD/DUF883 family membrane-anchored ribosome-binding protein